MNVKALDKLERYWIKLEWWRWGNKAALTADMLMSIVHTISVFKSNKSAQELAIAKIQSMPIYITIKKSEYSSVLDWIQSRMIEMEEYEFCEKISKLKKKL